MAHVRYVFLSYGVYVSFFHNLKIYYGTSLNMKVGQKWLHEHEFFNVLR